MISINEGFLSKRPVFYPSLPYTIENNLRIYAKEKDKGGKKSVDTN